MMSPGATRMLLRLVQLVVVLAAIGAYYLFGEQYSLIILVTAFVLIIGVSAIPIPKRQ